MSTTTFTTAADARVWAANNLAEWLTVAADHHAIDRDLLLIAVAQHAWIVYQAGAFAGTDWAMAVDAVAEQMA